LSDERHDAAILLKAVEFAARKHSTQRRKGADASPYINHPIAVAHLVADTGGVTDVRILMAAVLHDTVEDTQTTPEELEANFGPTVRKIVDEMTDDKCLEKQIRKDLQVEHAPRLSLAAKTVKIADKIANLQDVLDCPPAAWSDERRREYLRWTERVVAGCRGANPGLEKAYDALLARGRIQLGGSSPAEAPNS